VNILDKHIAQEYASIPTTFVNIQTNKNNVWLSKLAVILYSTFRSLIDFYIHYRYPACRIDYYRSKGLLYIA